MFKFLLRKTGRKVFAHHAQRHGWFDVRSGFEMMKSPYVATGSKLLALFLGIALTGVLVAAEAPLEAILGFFLPILGFAADFIVDGLEIVVFPVLIACILLPRIAKRNAPAIGRRADS